MFALVSFIIAAVLGFVVAIEASITSHDGAWAFFFLALGFVLDHLPDVTVRRGP